MTPRHTLPASTPGTRLTWASNPSRRKLCVASPGSNTHNYPASPRKKGSHRSLPHAMCRRLDFRTCRRPAISKAPVIADTVKPPATADTLRPPVSADSLLARTLSGQIPRWGDPQIQTSQRRMGCQCVESCTPAVRRYTKLRRGAPTRRMPVEVQNAG
jgi:hypothetical protein